MAKIRIAQGNFAGKKLVERLDSVDRLDNRYLGAQCYHCFFINTIKGHKITTQVGRIICGSHKELSSAVLEPSILQPDGIIA